MSPLEIRREDPQEEIAQACRNRAAQFMHELGLGPAGVEIDLSNGTATALQTEPRSKISEISNSPFGTQFLDAL